MDPHQAEPMIDEVDLEDLLDDDRPVFFDVDDYDFRD